MTTEPTAAERQALDLLACRVLGVETVETRNSDGLDFHDVAVWTIRKLVAEAYEMGRKHAA
jgi:uncharacterized protein DUF6900